MRYDRFASDISAVYELYSSALMSLLSNARLQMLSPSVILKLQVEGNQAMIAMLKAADALTFVYLTEVEGGTPTDPPTDRGDTDFTKALRVIAFKNVTQMVLMAKGGKPFDSLLTHMNGAMAALLKERGAERTLSVLDSAGRTWRSSTLAKFLARDFAYQTFLDIQAVKLAEQGDLVEVSYTDPTHANQGLVLSLSGAEGYPSLASVRAKIFHPNATAQLIHHVSAK